MMLVSSPACWSIKFLVILVVPLVSLSSFVFVGYCNQIYMHELTMTLATTL
jgi:hypothetical protein